MNNPRPESRITNLEKEFVELGSRIEEHVSDTAESLNALQLDVEAVRDDIKQGFDQAHTFINEHIATKADVTAVREDLRQLEDRIDHKVTAMRTEMKAMEERLVDTMKMLWQQRPSE